MAGKSIIESMRIRAEYRKVAYHKALEIRKNVADVAGDETVGKSENMKNRAIESRNCGL